MNPVLHQSVAESPLKEVADAFMAPVEALGKNAVQPVHAFRQAGPDRPNEKMVVVVHQAIPVHRPGVFIGRIRQQIQESQAVAPVNENSPTLVAAGVGVVGRPRVGNSELTGHTGIVLPEWTKTRKKMLKYKM